MSGLWVHGWALGLRLRLINERHAVGLRGLGEVLFGLKIRAQGFGPWDFGQGLRHILRGAKMAPQRSLL